MPHQLLHVRPDLIRLLPGFGCERVEKLGREPHEEERGPDLRQGDPEGALALACRFGPNAHVQRFKISIKFVERWSLIPLIDEHLAKMRIRNPWILTHAGNLLFPYTRERV